MTSGIRTQHLTDAEFSDLLAGDTPDGATRFHLASCAYCRGELESVQESLASFSGLSTRWAAAAAPACIPVPSRWALNLSSLPSWSTGLAITAFTGLLVFSFGPGAHVRRSEAPSPVVAAVAPSNTELANDNRLMLSIDQELSYGDRTASSISDGRGAAHRVGRHSPDTVVD